MSEVEPLQISNNEQLRIVVDRLDALTGLVEKNNRTMIEHVEESTADRVDLRQRIETLEKRPIVDAQDVDRIKAAIALQLRIHDWFMTHKVRAGIGATLAFVLGFAGGPILNVILHRLGWL